MHSKPSHDLHQSQSNEVRDKVDVQNKVRRAFRRQQVHQGKGYYYYYTTKRRMRRKSTNLNPKPLWFQALPASSEVQLHLQAYYNMNYFPGNDQKIALWSSTLLSFYGI